MLKFIKKKKATPEYVEKDDNTKEAYSGYIKGIWLELSNYKFLHNTINGEHDNYVGRQQVEAKLLSYLENGGDTGSYLVTGYRGMGKTSVVNRVVNQYKAIKKDKGEKVEIIRISFGQKDIKEIDLLRQVLKGIRDNLLNGFQKFLQSVFQFKRLPYLVAFVFGTLFILTVYCKLSLIPLPDQELIISKNHHTIINGDIAIYQESKNDSPIGNPLSLDKLGSLLLISFIISLIAIAIFAFIGWLLSSRIKNYNRLHDLLERCQSEKEVESGIHGAADKFLFGMVDKKIKKYPIANPKEIENEIIEILDAINPKPFWLYKFFSCSRKKRYVFIFDEIDKVDPSASPQKYYEAVDPISNNSNIDYVIDYRKRKKMVLDILSNLKYLITTAQSKFIFIAGREMFDASLADIADRQYSLGSIFNQVINVESFLKDKQREKNIHVETSGITELIESYLENILLTKEQQKTNDVGKNLPFLQKYFQHLKDNEHLTSSQILKILNTLQNFIIFLTYRSNGSPKKITRLFEEFIVSSSDFNLNDSLNKEQRFQKEEIINNKRTIAFINKSNSKNKKYFLKFDFNNQYRLGLISYIYRPFYAARNKFDKTFSDSLLVSTPFIMDHIIKFHDFAFSLNNLELVPEVISETKPPELRNYIEDIVNYFMQSHIRDTEIGLFQYKFLAKTNHEIKYLSKMFEGEAAAFNFTLDETLNVKLHLRNKIKELRNTFKELEKPNQHTHSISYLNEKLGDSEFFDQEYNEAVVSYSDAIQAIEKVEFKNFRIEDLMRITRLKLKLGLTYEKMKSNEIANGVYVDIILFTKELLQRKIEYKIKKQNEFQVTLKILGNQEHENLNLDITTAKDFMQEITHSVLAELFISEKVSIEGITYEKIHQAEDTLKQLNYQLCGTNKHKLIFSNFYSQIGTLVFYKNIPINRLPKNISEIENSIYEFLSIFESNDNLKSRKNALAYHYYKKSLSTLLGENENSIKPNFGSLLQLLRKAEIIMSNTIQEAIINPRVLQIIDTENYKANTFLKNYDKTYLKNVAIALCKLGDLLFSNISLKNETKITIRNEVLNPANFYPNENEPHKRIYYWSFHDFNNNYDGKQVPNDIKIQTVMCIYFWAGQFYLKAEKAYSCSFQFRKIIKIASNLLDVRSLRKYETLMEKFFLKKILSIASRNSSSTERFQISKLKYIIGQTSNYYLTEVYKKYIYLNTSNSSEVKEAILIFLEYQICAETIHYTKAKGYYYASTSGREVIKINFKNIVSPDSIISSQYIRIRECYFKARLNRIKLGSIKMFNTLACESNVNANWDVIRGKEIQNGVSPTINTLNFAEETESKENEFNEIAGLIISLIYCQLQIVTTFNRYGIGTLTSHTAFALSHKDMGDYLKYYQFFKKIYQANRDNYKLLNIEEKLINLVGHVQANTLIPTSFYQLALENFNKGKMLHSEGAPYKNMISKMYYLEDDFNISIQHYTIASERQSFNSNFIKKIRKDLAEEVNSSDIYQYPNYINDERFNSEDDNQD